MRHFHLVRYVHSLPGCGLSLLHSTFVLFRFLTFTSYAVSSMK